MTAFSPYQAYPGPAPVRTGPPPVFVAVAGPAPQRRLTVFFRGLLVVPHTFLLYWLALAAGIVAFIGWWGALFSGRLPQFAVSFLSGFLRWLTRVYAYYCLLTDVYPPFVLDDDPSYPVRVAIPEPQRLNRAAVFFRCILAFPAGFFEGIVIFGSGTLMFFVSWLITLFSGQMPPSLHLAYAAVLRFQVRYLGYWWMLTPAYPGGLYGDGPETVAWADALPAAQAPGPGAPAPGFGTPGQAYGTPGQAYGAPGAGFANPAGGAQPGYEPTQAYQPTQGYQPAQGYGGAQPGYGAPGYAAPAGYGAPAPAYGAPAGYAAGYRARPAFQPATWLLLLTSGAKKMVTTFIVLGSLVLAGYIALYALIAILVVSRTVDSMTTVTTADQLNSSYTALSDRMDAYDQAAADCHQQVACLAEQAGKAASYYNTFSAELADTSLPAGSAAAKAKLGALSATIAQDFTELSQTTSGSQYEATLDSTGLQQALDDFDQDYTDLLVSLSSAPY